MDFIIQIKPKRIPRKLKKHYSRQTKWKFRQDMWKARTADKYKRISLKNCVLAANPTDALVDTDPMTFTMNFKYDSME